MMKRRRCCGELKLEQRQREKGSRGAPRDAHKNMNTKIDTEKSNKKFSPIFNQTSRKTSLSRLH